MSGRFLHSFTGRRHPGQAYHICQWAELMERNGNKFYKADTPKYTLENVTQEEFALMYRPENENENRGCIGYIRADFDTGKSFYTTWFGENDSLKTADFKSEVDNVINYFRFESHTPSYMLIARLSLRHWDSVWLPRQQILPHHHNARNYM